ncbi:hypothetical protein SAMN05216389_14013 [Oceanobacillus limi]|uniref:Uncharacterized protein n=1 Tax=Oceanobacillus limi TaxID=930131 RepID=A0A1I0HM32_9BACI|nr:hypothetical protein [Oceanobacillus limi]SET85077.1 hypothetical protein SAMN05216389_14013 [Oceanobacillus limi]
MNTLTRKDAYFKGRYDEQVILLEGKELGISKRQLKEITELHNKGMHYKQISKRVKRDPIEVIVALLHQVDRKKPMKPFAYLFKDGGQDE